MIIRLAQTITLLFCLFSFAGRAAETITGVVIEVSTGKPLAGVLVENMDGHTLMTTDSNGTFTMAIARGQLIEFKKPRFKTQRWKVPTEGIIPPYFKVYLQIEVIKPGYVFDGPPQSWKEDSARYARDFETALKFPKMSTLEKIKSPFSAMSKHNQQIWAFQEEYAMFQQEKYIDYTFSKALVSKLTGLSDDSAAIYVRMFRPHYDQLRNMKEYDLFSYINRTVKMYREGYNPRRPVSRTTN